MLLTWRRPGREIRNTHQRSPTLLSSLISISQASCLGESSHLRRLTANACKGIYTIATAVPTLFLYYNQRDRWINGNVVRFFSARVSQAHDTIWRINITNCFLVIFQCRCDATYPRLVRLFATVPGVTWLKLVNRLIYINLFYTKPGNQVAFLNRLGSMLWRFNSR